jgi:hypothetical protein
MVERREPEPIRTPTLPRDERSPVPGEARPEASNEHKPPVDEKRIERFPER